MIFTLLVAYLVKTQYRRMCASLHSLLSHLLSSSTFQLLVWLPLISCCSLHHHLEYFTCPHPVISIYLIFPVTVRIISVSTVISLCYYVALQYYAIVDSIMTIAMLATFKKTLTVWRVYLCQLLTRVTSALKPIHKSQNLYTKHYVHCF